MMHRGFLVVLSIALVSLGTGCSGGAKTDVEEKIDPARAQVVAGQKLLHEWKKVFAIELKGGQNVRTHVGFIDRRFSEADPDGKSFVLDKTHAPRGFLLASGRAFAFEGGDTGSARDLGNMGIENGVKRILGVAGAVEIETVSASTPAPAGASSSERS